MRPQFPIVCSKHVIPSSANDQCSNSVYTHLFVLSLQVVMIADSGGLGTRIPLPLSIMYYVFTLPYTNTAHHAYTYTCRAAFLAFCNHSESRRLFVHLEEEGEGTIMRVSARPPQRLSEKSITFLKCSHASKLTRESIGRDVVYSECSELPLGK